MPRRPAERHGRRPHLVASVVGATASPFELGVACEVFGFDRPELADPWYRHIVCAVDGEPVSAGSGWRLSTPYGLAHLHRADTIFVPGWPPDQAVSPALAEALRAAHRRGARMVSACTGAFLLAAAGLLDGRRATTHWRWAGQLASDYPRVEVDPHVLYIDDGDLLTSAGTASAIDLCLHLVRLDHGAEVANAVARRMVVPPHREGGQAQFVEAPVPRAGDGPIDVVTTWMLRHLDESLTVEELAARALMSPRTFARRFREATGATPHQWLLHQRVLLAQRLLETTGEPVEVVATRCGFGSAAALRAHFQRQVGSPPMNYRRAFQCEEAS
jgi:transcriptional regulator GlxA family with amidase domain